MDRPHNRRPVSSPRLPVEREEVLERARGVSDRPTPPGSDREFLLAVLRDQTEFLTEQIEDLKQRDRSHEQDIGVIHGRLEAALRPSVVAAASTEGQAAGHVAGARAGQLYASLGAILAIVVSSALSYCEQRAARGFEPPAVVAPK